MQVTEMMLAHCISKVAHLQDMEEIYAWEQSKLKEKYLDRDQCQFLSWQAPWRKESLEHYLSLGWSFLLRSEKEGALLGYYLAQPLLFYRSQTQSLWVEYLQYQKREKGGKGRESDQNGEGKERGEGRERGDRGEREERGNSGEIQKALCELALQSARDKHLQQVLFYRAGPSEILYNPIELQGQGQGYREESLSCWVVPTTKIT